MSEKKYDYPKFFPDGCPPEDAEPMELKVYRLVKEDKISKDDFKSFFEEGRDARNPKLPYVEYGLSVNTKYEEIKKYWRGNPALKKKFRNVASGLTYKYTGVVKPTPSKAQRNHYTWWLCKDASPENYFLIE
ncbi:hypothetical protein [Virgibacillus halodenitrificans]|uniref:hypothetical protein n=1 Tax=Virgibacillus halodenitrificans TaxID=1482 RepID=UPI00045D4531|nr:hypothetical protein [Virgibacillus halodenitrificans]CDQ37233.1 hypothetical protein BN993_06776 [Virgibacillus halodenitrificans]